MFTGIIEEVGRARLLREEKDIFRYLVHSSSGFTAEIAKGDSISVNGVCLTAYDIGENSFSVDISVASRDCTTFGCALRHDHVNLERAVTPTTRLGGHFVSGHVDGVGALAAREDGEHESVLWFSSPPELLRYIAPKGSISVDGVSLTVNEVKRDQYCVTVIPHTLDNTILGMAMPGDKVNMEVDLIARYLENLMQNRGKT
ncbi:MAG: riboflavin synthase [Gammaproteobacteria bacterium]|nr:riboflavin synthase [Gammaproteobacteria bacterium]